MGGGGFQNCPKLRDVIYGRPLVENGGKLYSSKSKTSAKLSCNTVITKYWLLSLSLRIFGH